MNRRLLNLLLNGCRFGLLVLAILALGVAAVWNLRPQWVHRLDDALQQRVLQRPQERLQQALAQLGTDRAASLQTLSDLHEELIDVRRGDRLEAVAALTHYYLSLSQAEDGLTTEAVATARAVVALDPRNVDGLLNLAEIQSRAGRGADAVAELLQLHARVPHAEKVTALLVRLGLELSDDHLVPHAVAAFENATRSNRWQVSYLLAQSPLREFNLLQQGLLVSRLGADGRQVFSFALRGAVERLQFSLPPFALVRVVEPRLRIDTAGTSAVAEAPQPSPGLTAVPGGFEARGADRNTLEYALPELPAGGLHSFEFSARLEPLLSPRLVELLGGTPGDGILRRLAAEQRDEDWQRLHKYRLTRLAQASFQLFWRSGDQAYDGARSARAAPQLSVTQQGALSFRVELPLGTPVDHLRVDLPEEPDRSYRLTSVLVRSGDSQVELLADQLTVGRSHNVAIDGAVILVTGSDPYFDLPIDTTSGPGTVTIRGEVR